MALFLAGIAVFASLYATQPLLPELSRRFDVSPASSGLTVSLTTLGLALGLLLAGGVSERFGRTWLVHLSLAAATVLGVLCALSPSWSMLLVGRTLLGFALAGLPAVGVAYLNEELQPAVAGRAIGLYIGGNALGGMLGRLTAGVLADLGGWRLAVGGIAVLTGGCAVAAGLLLPRSRRFIPAEAGWRVLVRSTRGVLNDPVLIGLYVLAAVLMGGFIGVFNALGFRLEGPPYGLSSAAAGLVFLVYALGSVASAAAGRLADRHGRRPVVPLAVLAMLTGLALTGVHPLAGVVAALALLTAGFFAAHGVASGWVAARAGAGGRATAQAASAYLFAYYVGSSIGGGVVGRAWTVGGWSGVQLLTGAFVLAGLVVSVLLSRSTSLLQRGNPPVGG